MTRSRLLSIIVLAALLGLLPGRRARAAWDEGYLHFAPEVALALPQPLQVGTEAYENLGFRVYLDIGFLKIPPANPSKYASMFNLEAGARWFPWLRWWSIACALGYRRIGLMTDVSTIKIGDQSLGSLGQINLNTLYLNPSIGLDVPLSKRVSIGVSAGIQLAILGTGSMSLQDTSSGETSANSDRLKIDSSIAMSRVAALAVPQVTLLRVKWEIE